MILDMDADGCGCFQAVLQSYGCGVNDNVTLNDNMTLQVGTTQSNANFLSTISDGDFRVGSNEYCAAKSW